MRRNSGCRICIFERRPWSRMGERDQRFLAPVRRSVHCIRHTAYLLRRLWSDVCEARSRETVLPGNARRNPEPGTFLVCVFGASELRGFLHVAAVIWRLLHLAELRHLEAQCDCFTSLQHHHAADVYCRLRRLACCSRTTRRRFVLTHSRAQDLSRLVSWPCRCSRSADCDGSGCHSNFDRSYVVCEKSDSAYCRSRHE